MKSKKTLIFIAGLVVIVILLIPFIISYSNLTFLPTELTYASDNLVSKIPLLPKTSRQILVRSKVENQKLQSYKTKTKLELTTQNYKLVSVAIDGSVKNAGSDKVESSSLFQGQTLFPSPLIFNFQTTAFGKDFYFRVNRGAAISGFDTTKIPPIWYRLDLSEIQKDVKINSRADKDIVKDESIEFEKYFTELVKGEAFKKASVTTVKKDGSNYYQIKIAATKEPLTKLLLGDSLKDKKVEITILVDKNNYLLKSFEMTSTKATKDNSQVKIYLSYLIAEQNKNFKVEVPKEAMKINNPVELNLLLKNGNNNSSVEDVFKAIGGEVEESTTNFLTAERFTRVVLLFPRAL